ncbi:MAG: motility protein A [Alphaproteobacteria bacterium]
MDVATLVGVISGTVLVLTAIFLGGGVGMFLNVPSVMITVGGTVAATLINFPLNKVIGVFAVAKNAFTFKVFEAHVDILRMVEYARIARREGLLALEDKLEELDEPFLIKGIQLVIDGTSPEALRDILRTEIDFMQERHGMGKMILESMGASAPAFGLIGTLIGLVQMLRTLDDPSKIGQGMSVALLTTFYGAFMANLLFLPLAGKLDLRSREEVLIKELMIEGIIAIQSGDNPRLVKEKLKSYVSPDIRDQLEEEEQARE